MFKFFVVCFGFVFSLNAVENRLVCSDCSLFLSDCVLSAGSLSIDSSFEREFEIKLDFNCQGHKTNVGLQTDKGFHTIKPSPEQQIIKITGKQLNLTDPDPKKTLASTFNPGCELKIHKVSQSLSADSKAKLDNYDGELNRLADSILDLKTIDDQIINLMESIEELNPENLNWAVATLKKIANKLLVPIEDPAFPSKTSEIQALKEAVLKTKEVLRDNLITRVRANLNRMDAIVFEAVDMTVFTSSSKLEEKVMQVKNVFKGDV